MKTETLQTGAQSNSTARAEIDLLYTPLDEAVEELHRRRQDMALCARVEEFHRVLPPTFIPPKLFAGLFRYLSAPNFEFELFLKIASQAELHPLYVEYQRDIFVTWNRDKYRLCRPRFAVQRNQVRNLRLVNFEERWTPLFGPRNAEIKLGSQALLD